MRKKLLIAAGAIFLLMLLSIYLVNSPYTKNWIAGFLSRYVKNRFGLTLEIGSLDYDWRPFTVRLNDLQLENTDLKTFCTAKSVNVSIPYSSFRSDLFLVRELVIDTPICDFDHAPHFPSSGSTSSGGKANFRLERVVIKSGEMIIAHRKFEKINSTAIVDPATTTIPQLTAMFGSAEISARGTIENFKRYQFQYDAKGNAILLSDLFHEIPKMSGNITAKGKLEGKGAEFAVTGNAAVDSLMIEGYSPFAVSTEYTIAPKEEKAPYEVKLKWTSLPWALLRKYYPELPDFGTRVNGSLDYSGGNDLMNGSGAVQADLENDGSRKTPLTGNLRGRFKDQSVQLQPSIIAIRSTRAQVSGNIFQSKLQLNVRATSQSLSDLSLFSPQLNRFPGAFQFNGTLSGPYRRLQAKGKIVGTSNDLQVNAEGSYTTGSNALDLTFSGNAGESSIKRLVSTEIEGEVSFTGQARGTVKNPVLQADVSIASMKVKGVDLGNATATLDSDGKVLNAVLEFPAISTKAKGDYRFGSGKYSLEAHIENLSVDSARSLLPDSLKGYSGNLTGVLTASGTIDHWKNSEASLVLQNATMDSDKLHVKLLPESQFQLAKGIVSMNAKAELPEGTLQVEGTVTAFDQHHLDLHATGETNAEFISLLNLGITASGPISIDTHIEGTTSKPDLSGTIRSDTLEVSYPSQSLFFKKGSLVAEFSGTKVMVKGEGLLNDSPISLDGTIPFKREKGEIHFDLRSFPIVSLLPNSKLSGTVDVAADFEGLGFPYEDLSNGISRDSPIWDWNGTLKISPSNLKIGEREIKASEPLVVSLQKSVLQINTWQLTSGELLDFVARGGVNLDTGVIDAGIRASLKVDLLSSIRADIQSNGPLSVDLNIGGTLNKPEFSGSVDIRGASLRVPNYQLAFDDVNLHAAFDADHLQIETLTARAGGGSVTGGGEIYLRGQDPSRKIWLKGTNVGSAYPVGLRSQLDFSLDLALVKRDFFLSGDVQILRSNYTENLGFKNRLLLTLLNKQKALFQQEFLKSSVKLAVKIETVDDFRLNNNLGLIRASADLQINGTLAQPKVNGRIHVQGGSRVYFLGRRYDVETGTIDFYGTTKLLPVLNITMTTLVQDYSGNNFYEITLPIVGPLDKLEYRNPRSVPSLTDDQIYSLLLTGSTAGTQGAQSPAVLFQKELVAFMSGQVFFGVEDTFARTFGLTRVDVQQNLLTTGDNAGAKLIVGKDIGSAFSLTYSFPLNDTNKQTWITSYRYKRNYIFRAIRQEDNSYTISGRHTVLFGKGTAYSYISKGEEKKILEPRIASMKIENDSPISNEEVGKKIKLAEGDLYDYWKLQDNLEELEKTFQDKGYLFPRAEVNEQDFDNNTVALTIQVSAGLPRTMSFEGMKIKGKQLDQYKKWWREGLSENLVIALIQQDLLRSLWLDGYHQASVNQTTSTNNNVIDYHFEISPGIKFTVAEIKFQGNKLINSDDLTKGILVFYESHNEMISEAIHDFAKFKQKVEAAYIQKGLLLSKPEPGPLSSEPKSGKIVRQVFIQEGPYSKIAEVHVEGGPSFPPQLAGHLKVKQGDVVDLEVLPDNEAIIQDFYETQGYRSFSIQTILKRKPNTSDLILTYDETVGVRSIIASIEIRGNEVTRTSLIESRLNLKPGDVLTDQKIAEAQKRLYELGVFQQVKMETEPSEKAGELDLIVYCVEGKQYELQYGPRYNSDGGIGAEVSLVNYNLFGHAQRGSFYGRYDGNRPVYRFDYWVPNLSGFWSNTLFSLYYQVQEDLITRNFQNSPDFTLRTAIGAFQVQQDRRLKGFLRILYGFAAGTSTVKPDVVTGTDNSVTGTFVDFSTSLYIDTRDDPLNAKRGQFLSLDGSAAPKIGTDIQFTRAYAQYFLYKRVGRVIWASGVRAGFLKTFSDEFTLDERFQAGGGTTVRGFRTDDLTPKDTDAIGFLFGGDAVFILNQEIRFPIHKWLGGAVFYDAGNVYRFLRDFNPLDLRNTGGFGLRIDNPYVILRFDVGFNFNPMNDEPRVVFHFGIGQAF